MAQRQIVDIDGLLEVHKWTKSKHRIYKLTKRKDFPLPYKKVGKMLLFDLEAVEKWFDSLPGRDETVDF